MSIKCNKFPIIYSWKFLIRHLWPVLHLYIYSLSVRIFYCKIVAYEPNTWRWRKFCPWQGISELPSPQSIVNDPVIYEPPDKASRVREVIATEEPVLFTTVNFNKVQTWYSFNSGAVPDGTANALPATMSDSERCAVEPYPICLGVRLTVYPFVPEGLAPYSKGYKHTNHTRRKPLSIPCVVLTSYALECRIISSR